MLPVPAVSYPFPIEEKQHENENENENENERNTREPELAFNPSSLTTLIPVPEDVLISPEGSQLNSESASNQQADLIQSAEDSTPQEPVVTRAPSSPDPAARSANSGATASGAAVAGDGGSATKQKKSLAANIQVDFISIRIRAL